MIAEDIQAQKTKKWDRPGLRAHQPKTLVVCPGPVAGGCERYAVKLAEELVESGIDVVAALRQRLATRNLRERLRARNIPVWAWMPTLDEHVWIELNVAVQQRETRRLIERLAPNTVIAVLPSVESGLGILEMCACLDVPVLAVFQLVDGLPTSKPSENLKKTVFAGRQVWVGVSQEIAHRLRSYLGCPDAAGYVEVIPNGIHQLPHLRPKRGLKSVRAELGLAARQRIILTVGSLTRQKGYDILIAAAAAALDESSHYVWAGEGHRRREFAQQIRSAGIGEKVHMLGWREDARELIAAADLFVLPSRAEGASFAVLEAMMDGCPVVVSRAAAGDLIRADIDGVVVPNESPAALTRALDWAAVNRTETRAMAAEAQRRAIAEFSHEQMIGQTIGAFCRLLSA